MQKEGKTKQNRKNRKTSKKGKRGKTAARPLSLHILYFSAAGSTRKVAQAYEKEFKGRGHQVKSHNLARHPALEDKEKRKALLTALSEADLLLVGSPILMDSIYQPLAALLEALPKAPPVCGVFTTFGKLSAGWGLAQATRLLAGKGGRVVSALEVDALHSVSRAMESPINPQLPDAALTSLIEPSTDALLKAQEKRRSTADLSLLLTQKLAGRPARPLKDQRTLLDGLAPVTFDEDRCISCGACIRACPVKDLSLRDGLPVHKSPSICMGCTNCYVVCPQGAVDIRLSDRAAFLTGRLKEEGLSPQGPSLSALYLV